MSKCIGILDDGQMKIEIAEMADESTLAIRGNPIRGWQEMTIVIRRGYLTHVNIRMLPMDDIIQTEIEEEEEDGP